MNASILNLYHDYLGETGEPAAAASLVLAQVQVEQQVASAASADIPGNQLIPISEAARNLGYKPAGLRKLAKQGAIRYVQNGRGPIRFRRDWLDEFVASNNPTAVKRSPAQRRQKPDALPRPTLAAQFGFSRELYQNRRAA